MESIKKMLFVFFHGHHEVFLNDLFMKQIQSFVTNCDFIVLPKFQTHRFK